MRRLAAGLFLLLLCACASGPQRTSRIALPPTPPNGEPSGYIGMTSVQLRAALGPPSFSRRENGSELWRYDTKECRAFFFLYAAGTGVSVRHVETMPPGKNVAADATCLTALRARPASPVS